MKTASRFDNRVENYVRYRPHYPPEILGLFRRRMNLSENSVIADIGSGTGISARLFLENGNKVYGIEPNELMRAASEEYLADFPAFEAIDATAEKTTLAPNSVDIVIAAQAFHWFDNDKTLPEFRRILRPGGFIALIWNERVLDADAFLRAYERFLQEFGTDYETVRHDRITRGTLEEVFGRKIRLKTFDNVQTLDFEGLKGRILSSSYMPAEENPRFPVMEKSLKRLFAEYAESGKIQILYKTNIFYASA